jgi:hypothetical protein
MKHTALTLLSILLFLFTVTPALSKDYPTAYIPKGGIMGVLSKDIGWVKVMVAEEVKIHVINIKTVANPSNPKEKMELVEFSLSYDKPKIVCKVHGADTYEMYSPYLGHDHAFIPKNTLIKYSEPKVK